jgi:Ca-activated chloride channel homolog
VTPGRIRSVVVGLGVALTVLAALALHGRVISIAALRLLQPGCLGLLGFAPWLVGSPSDIRSWIAGLLRAGAFCCLVLALCRPELQRASARVHLIVAADVSKSVRDDSLRFAADRVAELRSVFEQRDRRTTPRERGRLDVFSFATDARPLPATASNLPRLPSGPGGDDPGLATDLQRALRFAYGRFASDHVHNLLLVTDGNETRGDVLAEASRAARLGVRIDVLPLPAPTLPDVAVRSLSLPRDLAAGVPFTLRAELAADRPTHVRANLFAATDPAHLETTRELDLPAGSTSLEFPLTAKAPGRIEYRLELQPSAADRRAENDTAAVAADVPGPPRVLIVDSEPQAAAPLAQALRTRDFDVDVKPPAAAPRRDSDYANYAFVILSDLASRDLHPEAVSALTRYVQFGGGLLASGGSRSFGLGADRASALDSLWPVRAAAEEQRDQASLALALIIDCSGSMAGGKLDLAREAAALTAQTLADPDLIEVIGFSSQPERRVRLQPASNRASIAQSIARLAATGGTQLYPALDAAYRDLRGAQARLKHAILLTDGQTQEAGIEDLASSMRADGITLSTVGLGTEVNRALLETVAGLGGGRAYFPLDAQTVPQIFMSEASRQKRPSAVDRSTRAFEREHAGFLEGIALRSAPTLAGYVTTQAKPTPAQVILETDRGEPLLARWRVGLGYALAWTSDLKPRWASSFLRWPSFARFIAQLVREHMRAPELREAPVEVRVERDQLRVIADALGGNEQFENSLDAKVRVLSQAGEVSTAAMTQTGPGRYEARLAWIRTGAFTLEVSFHRAGRLQAWGHARFATAYPAELEAPDPNAAVLAQVAASTGGRQLTTAAEALDAGGRRVTLRDACWPALTWLALGLFLLAQCVRHARLLGRTPPPHRTGK